MDVVGSDALAGCETDAGVGVAEAAGDVPEGAELVDRVAESVGSGEEEARAEAVAEGGELAETTDCEDAGVGDCTGAEGVAGVGVEDKEGPVFTEEPWRQKKR